MNSDDVKKVKALRYQRYLLEQTPLLEKALIYPEKAEQYLAQARQVRAKIKAELPIEHEDKMPS